MKMTKGSAADVETLLLVDDTPDNLLVMKKVLQKALPHVEIMTFQKPEDVMDYVRTADVSVALLDVQMPVMNGLELCELMKASEETRHIPVILITSHESSSRYRASGLDAGADDFLTRPMDNDELVARVKVALRISRAEAQLRRMVDQVQQDYQLLFEAEPECVKIVSPEGVLLNMNPSGLKMIEAESLAQAQSQPLIEFVAPEYRAAFRELLGQVIQGQSKTLEFECVGLKGERRWLESHAVPLWDAENSCTNLLSVTRDITERKRSEQALTKSEALLNEVGRVAQIGGWEMDLVTRKSQWTRTTYELVGIDPGDPIPGPDEHLQYYVEEDRPLIAEGMRALIEDDVPIEIEARAEIAGRGIRWFRVRGQAVCREGQCVRVYGTLQDITNRKEVQAEREKLQGQLAQAQRMESIGRLAGGVAHDFNNMLMGVMNYAELCRDKIEPDHPIREWLNEITVDAERSTKLTHQLLAFARKQIIAPKVIDINDAIASMLKLLRRLIGEDIAINLRPGPDVWPVKMDPVQVDQILANLAVNARDAIGGVGSISIETSNATFDAAYCDKHAGALPGDYMLLTVSDSGCGMDEETLTNIFEPFFTTKGEGEGTGLGLATVYGIVKQNDGFINVYSEPDKGTTFRIYLPRFADAKVTEGAAETPTKPPRGTETVLLVEDEKSVRVTTQIFLEDLGYTVLVAEDPKKALHLVAEHPGELDLLVTDVIMPGMSGRDLADRLSELRPSIKSLFISGFTADVIAQRGILDDSVNFLSKPFGRDALARKVREVLRQGALDSMKRLGQAEIQEPYRTQRLTKDGRVRGSDKSDESDPSDRQRKEQP